MYPADPSTWVDEERLSRGLCGARRPGHFRGVATVVAKLFHLVLPDVAVFGEKDAQQLRVVRRMVRDLDFPVRIVAGPTVREPDGLAMSSRNAYLPPPERADARCLARALAAVRRRFSAGERSAARLRSAAEAEIRPVASARIDYVEVVDDATLEPVRRVARPALVALAVFVGRTRLIDNAVLRPPRRARRARTG
jgi:pantoate--beta-alanine ligase